MGNSITLQIEIPREAGHRLIDLYKTEAPVIYDLGIQQVKQNHASALRGDLGRTTQKDEYNDLGQYLYKIIYNFLRLPGTSAKFPALNQISDDESAELAETFVEVALQKADQLKLYNRYQYTEDFTAWMIMDVNRRIKQSLQQDHL